MSATQVLLVIAMKYFGLISTSVVTVGRVLAVYHIQQSRQYGNTCRKQSVQQVSGKVVFLYTTYLLGITKLLL